jgi:hypothetical protein
MERFLADFRMVEAQQEIGLGTQQFSNLAHEGKASFRWYGFDEQHNNSGVF